MSKQTKSTKPGVAARRTLSRLQTGLASKRLTLQAVSRESGIPLTTLADMTKPEWGERSIRTIERMARLEEAISRLEAVS